MQSDMVKTQAFLAAIIDSTDDAVIGKSLDGEILSWNKGAEKIYGHSSEEILGKNISTIIPADRKSEQDTILQKVSEGGMIDHYETVRVTKSGVRVPVSLTISPIKDKNGTIIGASTIARNTSSHKRMEEKLREEKSRTEAILDNVVDGIITIDEAGTIQTYNPAAENLFGYSREEAVGKNVRMLMPEPFRGEHDQYIKNYLTSGKAQIIGIGREVVGLTKRGLQFPMELAISEVWVQGQRIFTGIVRDISERKKAEQEIRLAHKEAERANQAKSIFLANMSHEIRTPLNAILGYSQIILRNKALDQKTRESVKTIDTSGKNLLTMINEILDISKIEAGKMELVLNDFNLKESLSDIKNMFLIRTQQKKLSWHFNLPEKEYFVHGDESKLRQVLINLIGNAVKFTQSGEIIFNLQPLDNNNFLFEVIDTGQGISLAAQKTIFDPFSQDDAGAKMGGTGLGLTITKKQLTLMGGDLKLESKENIGSRFYFELYLAPAKNDNSQSARLEGKVLHLAEGSHCKALVVDDIQENRDVLSGLLKDIGAEVIEAENGLEGVNMAREHAPDIIFMDMRMPVMRGEEAVEHIIKEFGPDRFKIVSITASAFDRHKDFYLQLGCHDYISKPFREEDIFVCLKNVLEIDYTYEEADETEGSLVNSAILDFSSFKVPAELLDDLINAAELYNITRLETFVVNLEQTSETFKPLAKYIQTLADQYDMQSIMEVLRKVNPEP